MAIFPGAVSTDSDLYIAVNATSTQLTDNPLTSGATTVNVVSTTAFPTVGFISIDNEIIKYTGKTGTSFTGCTRGADGTSATSHVQNSQVFHNVIAAHHNALKDEIIAIESQLNAKLGTSGSAYTLSRALQTNASTGIIEVSSVTNTELGFLSGVTSAIQTQLNTKATDTLVVHLAGTETITGQKTFSSAILHADGTAALPSIAFSSDDDTGIFRVSANLAALSAGGTRILDWTTTGIELKTGVALLPDGSASNPSIAFSSDPDSGLYRLGANNIAIGTNGTRAIEITSTQAVKIKGTSTNDNATAGDVGQHISSLVSGVTIAATGTYGDVTSVSLTAGDWDVTGLVHIAASSGTPAVTRAQIVLSAFSGNTQTDHVGGDNLLDLYYTYTAGATRISGSLPVWRVSVASTTTIYLKARCDYATGALVTDGRISARRVR